MTTVKPLTSKIPKFFNEVKKKKVHPGCVHVCAKNLKRKKEKKKMRPTKKSLHAFEGKDCTFDGGPRTREKERGRSF